MSCVYFHELGSTDKDQARRDESENEQSSSLKSGIISLRSKDCLDMHMANSGLILFNIISLPHRYIHICVLILKHIFCTFNLNNH